MMSSNRSDYASAQEWLKVLRQDEAWLSQQVRLQTSQSDNAGVHRDDAIRRIGQGETFEFWEIYRHQVEPVVREVWEMAELSLPKLKIQTIGMLSLEWLEQQAGTCISVRQEKKRKEPKRKVSKPDRKTVCKPQTLKYYTHGNNSILMKQRKRVDIVFLKFNEWGWIDSKTTPEDFDTFFEGEPRHCNITWKGNSTILTILLQELLKQPYITKQTGCSAKSMVEQQFHKTANSDRTRLDADVPDKIKLVVIILDINNPLPERYGRHYDDYDEDDYDIQDAALMAIYDGQLRSKKGI